MAIAGPITAAVGTAARAAVAAPSMAGIAAAGAASGGGEPTLVRPVEAAEAEMRRAAARASGRFHFPERSSAVAVADRPDIAIAGSPIRLFSAMNS